MSSLNQILKTHHFTIATGRSLISCRDILQNIEFKLPVITNNGAIISYINENKPLKINSLSEGLFNEFTRQLGEFSQRLFVQTYCNEQNIFKIYYQEPQTIGQKWFVNQRISFGDQNMCQTSYDNRKDTEKIIQVILCEESDWLNGVYKRLIADMGGDVSSFLSENPYLKGHSWLDVSSIKANKGDACRWVCDQLGLSTKDLYVFGDGENDSSMFAVAGNSFAMGNATDSLKSNATQVLNNNIDSPVVSKINSLMRSL